MRLLSQLRRPSRLPPLSLLEIIRSYSRHSRHSKATAVLSFGDNSQGALGFPSPPFDAYEPTKIPHLPSNISSISAGHYHSLAVTASGEVWAWGRNVEGQLGRGLSSPRDTWNEPRKVEGLDDLRVRAAFASGVVSAAIGVDGSLWVWGKSKRGQLGLGKGVTEAIKPSKVEALAGKEIAKVLICTFTVCSTNQTNIQGSEFGYLLGGGMRWHSLAMENCTAGVIQLMED